MLDKGTHNIECPSLKWPQVDNFLLKGKITIDLHIYSIHTHV